MPFYSDVEFPANDSSLYKNPLEPPEYASKTNLIEWTRPPSRKDDKAEDEVSKFFIDSARPGEIKKGDLDDSWFLGALAMVATRPELFNNIIISKPDESFEYGFFVFRFFKNGKWEYVFIDSSYPTDPTTKNAIYGKCAT